MKVILKPVSGTPKANLERAKHEMERVLAFRGTVYSVKTLKDGIEVQISINPKWELPEKEKVDSLKECITAKVRSSFKSGKPRFRCLRDKTQRHDCQGEIPWNPSGWDMWLVNWRKKAAWSLVNLSVL